MENPNIEFASAEEIKAFQEKELAKHLAYLSANSPFYKKMFKENGIDPAAMKTCRKYLLQTNLTCKYMAVSLYVCRQRRLWITLPHQAH